MDHGRGCRSSVRPSVNGLADSESIAYHEQRPSGYMLPLVRFITALSRFFGGVAAALMVLILILVCQMAVMKYGLNMLVPWPPEIVAYLMMGVTFLGAPYVFAAGGHIAVDLFAGPRDPRTGRMRRTIATALSFVFAGGLTAAGIALLQEASAEGWRSDSAVWVALWVPYLTMPVGAALLTLQCVAEFAALISGRDSAGERPADPDVFPD